MSEIESDLESFPRLTPHELHVWRVDLDCPSAANRASAACLSAEERERAARFLRETDRRRFIVGHSVLRMILAEYLGIPPGRVETTVRPDGKPELTPSSAAPKLCFNLSHSDQLQMVAVALGHEVGIDVQRVNDFVDIDGIVRRYFAVGERAIWQSLPDRERLAAFFRCWTRKEAYLKARGVGLAAGLDRFEVTFAPGESPRLLRCTDDRGASARWSVYDVSPNDEYTAACVVQAGIERVTLLDWSGFS